MMSRTAAAVAVALALCSSLPALAEGSNLDTTGEGAYNARPFVVGDQTVGINVGAQIPLFALGGDSLSMNMYSGAGFGFTYQYFVAPGLAIGGTVEGSFNQTYGARNLFILPLTFRTAYWWTVKAFELGVIAEPGLYLLRLDGKGIVSPILKAGAVADWRVSNAWSVGVQAMYWFWPEIHTGDYADLTRYGNFLQTGILATYHL